MKKFYDVLRSEKKFEVGHHVYLKFQPYKKVSLVLRRNLKLSTRYYGPFGTTIRIGPVAYKLKAKASKTF